MSLVCDEYVSVDVRVFLSVSVYVLRFSVLKCQEGRGSEEQTLMLESIRALFNNDEDDDRIE